MISKQVDKKRVFLLTLSFLAVWYSPWWWMTAIIWLIAVIKLSWFYELLFPALLFDLLYSGGYWFWPGLMMAVVLLALVEYLKQSMRYAL